MDGTVVHLGYFRSEKEAAFARHLPSAEPAAAATGS